MIIFLLGFIIAVIAKKPINLFGQIVAPDAKKGCGEERICLHCDCLHLSTQCLREQRMMHLKIGTEKVKIKILNQK